MVQLDVICVFLMGKDLIIKMGQQVVGWRQSYFFYFPAQILITVL